MSRKWTSAQKEAISFSDNNLLVAAGAGSGKTGVLVERIIRKITDDSRPVSIEQLLVVTFTNAAANEMRQRIGKALENAAADGNVRALQQLILLNQASITTLHSFCLNLLHLYFYHLNLDPAFQIAKEAEMDLLKEDVLETLLEEKYQEEDAIYLDLVACYGGKEDEQLKNFLLQLYEYSCSFPQPIDWLEQLAAQFAAPLTEDTAWVKDLLQEAKIDMQEAVRLLTEGITLAQEYGFMAYLEQLEQEKESIQDLLSSQSWSMVQKAFGAEIFVRLKNEKGEEEQKEKIKCLRNRAKNLVQYWQKKFFACSLADYEQDIKQIAPYMAELVSLCKEFTHRFRLAKQKRNLIDFSDMEQYALQLLRQRENGVADELKERFVEVMIDEYQDINDVQEAILHAVSNDKNRFMVGDDKQSIYRFRMAQPRLFLEKKEQYAKNENGSMVVLQHNFRSCPNILQSVNFLFRQIMSKTCGEISYDESVFLQSEQEDASVLPVELYILEKNVEQTEQKVLEEEQEKEEAVEAITTAKQEARVIATRIHALHEQGYNFRDMVVLMRSPRYWVKGFLEELNEQGIPVYGEDNDGYFATSEIQLLVALLQILDNAHQDIPLAAVLRSPFGRFSLDELVRIARLGQEDFYENLKEMAQKENDLAQKCSVFLQTLHKWQTWLRTGSIANFIYAVYQENHFFDWVGALPTGKQKQANLRAFYQFAKEYEEGSYRGLYGFLRFIQKIIEKGNDMGSARTVGENEDVVKIQSIHSAKGLEYKVVFVAGLGRRFNKKDSQGSLLLHRELGIGPMYVNRKMGYMRTTLPREAMVRRLQAEAIAEEMRILYVALTRAKEKLVLIGSLRNLHFAVGQWLLSAKETNWSIPPSLIANASCPLEWLGRCLIRHQDGSPLSALLEEGNKIENVPTEIWQYPCHWQIKAGSLSQILSCLQEKKTSNEIQQRQVDGETIAYDSELEKQVMDILQWQYPYHYSLHKQAKWTVTDVNKLYFSSQETQDGILWPLGEQKPLNRVSQKKIEKGVAYHYVM